jgi:hypothetical protein
MMFETEGWKSFAELNMLLISPWFQFFVLYGNRFAQRIARQRLDKHPRDMHMQQ